MQLRMNIGFNISEHEIYYGVPYGIQRFGNYMEGVYPFNPTEISNELFEEYREVQGLFILQNPEYGVSVSTNQSSFAFEESTIEAVLVRNVRSCGDNDMQIPNFGELRWDSARLGKYGNVS